MTDGLVLTYKNVYTGGFLICELSRGQIRFHGESISAIVILREYITGQATSRRFQLQECLQCDSQTVFTFLSLLRPKLEALLQVARQVELIEAIQEITAQDTDKRWLSPEYAEILENADRIREAFKARPHALEYLSGIITDLYVDYHKLQGLDVSGIPPAHIVRWCWVLISVLTLEKFLLQVKHQLPELQQMIVQANFEQLLAVFQSSQQSRRR
jgi:Bardet-Biedl syndrome 7 protein